MTTRRAQPGLGTLVEIGTLGESARQLAAIDAAFDAIRGAQACLSRFDRDSDIARFNALAAGARIVVRPITRRVLEAVHALRDATDDAFDVSLGSGPRGWSLVGNELRKHADGVCLDLGGIGKGFVVDLAAQALRDGGVTCGWVNAGGDLRAFGEIDLPIRLRDETGGGAREFATLRDGAFATSHYAAGSHSRLSARAGESGHVHVSVAAPLCGWADALTKVVALSGDASHPLLTRFGATAWLH